MREIVSAATAVRSTAATEIGSISPCCDLVSRSSQTTESNDCGTRGASLSSVRARSPRWGWGIPSRQRPGFTAIARALALFPKLAGIHVETGRLDLSFGLIQGLGGRERRKACRLQGNLQTIGGSYR